MSAADSSIQLFSTRGQGRHWNKNQPAGHLGETVPLCPIFDDDRSILGSNPVVIIHCEFCVRSPGCFQIGRDEIHGFRRRPALDRHHAGWAEKKCLQLFGGLFARRKEHIRLQSPRFTQTRHNSQYR